jgi:membrane protein implicated in regulation of membrane protease activity
MEIAMEQYAWIFWLVLGVLFIVAEIFTFGFVLFWFGIGALLAALVSFLGFGFTVQFLVFAGISILLTVFSRKIFSSFLSSDQGTKVLTGVDSLPGKIGTVITSSKGALNEASVKVYGTVWTAFPEEGEESLEEGEKVMVTRVEGACLYVKKVKDLPPSWRQLTDS